MRKGGGWEKIAGKLTQVSVGCRNQIAGVNRDGNMYKYDIGDNKWRQLPGGNFKHCSIDEFGMIYAVTHELEMYKLYADNWMKLPGEFKFVSLGRQVWALDKDGQLVIAPCDRKPQIELNPVWFPMNGKLKHISVSLDGERWGVNAEDSVYRRVGKDWIKMPGKLKMVSCGSRTEIYGVNGDDNVYKWNGESWDKLSGKLKYVSVGSDGTCYGVNADDVAYIREGDKWAKLPGKLRQIEVGSKDYVVGVNGANNVYRFNVQEGKWEQLPGSLTHVTVDNHGRIYGCNQASEIFRLTAQDTWSKLPGKLKNVTIGGPQLFGVNEEDNIYTAVAAYPGARPQRPTPWQKTGMSLSYVSAAEDGTVWGIDSDGTPCYLSGSEWQKTDGNFMKISCGNSSEVWGCAVSGEIYRYFGSWKLVSGKLTCVSVGADGFVAGTNAADDVYFRAGDKWNKVEGKLKHISVGSKDHIVGVNSQNQVFKYQPQSKSWRHLPGTMTFACVDAYGMIYAINENRLYQYYADNNWTQLSGQVEKIAVGQRLWAVAPGHNVLTAVRD
eukprot:m.10517 g.10517  ORF g.10517 m.10517 type:complete len:552 (-) comp7423_c0_seq1:108-1763(-)